MEGKKIILYTTAVIAVLSVVFLPGLSRLHKLRRENAQLQKRIRFLEEHNDVLEEEIVKMREDPGYVEKKAREKLGILKDDEIIYEPASGKNRR
ncbi:MAG: septum formation initiator family protein [Candidatus Omnitrophota bacterium]